MPLPCCAALLPGTSSPSQSSAFNMPATLQKRHPPVLPASGLYCAINEDTCPLALFRSVLPIPQQESSSNIYIRTDMYLSFLDSGGSQHTVAAFSSLNSRHREKPSSVTSGQKLVSSLWGLQRKKIKFKKTQKGQS